MIDRYAPDDMKTLWSEKTKYQTWWQLELAVIEAWEQVGEIPAGTAASLASQLAPSSLDEAFADRVAELEAITRHDIVAFTRTLTEYVDDKAKFVHMGLTSTDVVDSAQNMLLVKALDIILTDLNALLKEVSAKAKNYKYSPCIGRTHGIHAEPMTFGLKFLNFYKALERDYQRLERAKQGIAVMMLSGSVGTYAHVPPEIEQMVAQNLGMQADSISNQTVARDRHAEVLSALAILGTSLERIAVEIRHLQRTEVREAQEGFRKGQTGSSSMPHKKNPIATENITGVARLLRSNLQAGLENVALWHERDISHSSVERVILPDSTMLTSYALRRMTRVMRDLIVYPERMLSNMDSLNGLVFSQRVLHQLIDTGMMREQAYAVVQRNSLKAWESGEHLQDLLQKDSESPLSQEELARAFDVNWYLRYVDHIYQANGFD